MNPESIAFEETIQKVNFYLRLTGTYIKEEDVNRTLKERLLNRWFYCFNFIMLNYDSFAFFGLITTLPMKDVTRMIPCAMLCFVGDFKSFYFLKNHHYVVDLINAIKSLQSMKFTEKTVENEMIGQRLPFLYLSFKILLASGIAGVSGFFIGPALFTLLHYLKYNDIKLMLPFLVWYPFDPCTLTTWPFVVAHQFWSAFVTVFYVFGTDCFYYGCCVYIHLQFQNLKCDMENITECFATEGNVPKLHSLIHRHREIIRCIILLNNIYGKSTFFNVMSSSLIICITGFNIIAIDDWITMAPFTPFLALGSYQIFLFCYYGDILMRDSVEISDAIYNSEWYTLKASSMKYCHFILMRAQKPCRVSAYGFLDINMKAYTRILSSAWSYFTLLRTIYANKTSLE